MLTLSRRALLAGLASWPLAARAAVPPPVRSWSGRGHIVVLATAHGDPRYPPGADGSAAMELALALGADTRVLVAATGVPPRDATDTAGPEDAARLAAGGIPKARLIEGGASEFDALVRLAKVSFGQREPWNPVFRARRAALAREDGSGGYDTLQAEGLARLAGARQAMAAAQLERRVDLPRRAVVVVSALAAPAWCAALEAEGRGGMLVATPAAEAQLPDGALFWAAQQAGLPSPGGVGLAPWARSMGPYLTALQGWSRRASMIEAIEASSGKSAPALSVDDPLRRHVEAASALLEKVGLVSLKAAPDLSVAEGPAALLAMSYDSWSHQLRVARWTLELPVNLAAAILLHELTHVEDVAALCRVHGIVPRTFALALDTLPQGIAVGILCSMEDLAYRREVEAVGALGIALPPLDQPFQEGAEARVLQLLAMLAAVRPASARWLSLVDAFVMERFRTP